MDKILAIYGEEIVSECQLIPLEGYTEEYYIRLFDQRLGESGWDMLMKGNSSTGAMEPYYTRPQQ